MSGIAEVLVNMGCTVSGSDVSHNAQVSRLEALGVKVHLGHQSSNVNPSIDVVVYSSAVKADNPEIKQAVAYRIPIIQRAEMLAELMRLKRGVAIGGSHGKTTTTSMTAAVMLHGKLDPTIVIGGRLDLIKSTAALGKGAWLLAEADESDGSFLKLSPEIAVITNIDNDHLDHYHDFERLKQAFGDFIQRIPFYGSAIVCGDDPHVSELAKGFKKRILTYGFGDDNQLRAEAMKVTATESRYTATLNGKAIGEITLHVPGRHNVLNSLAAVAVGLELRLDFHVIAEGLKNYRGVDRRLQYRGLCKGAVIIDDYGHHPTEVRATLEAVKQAYPKHRIVVAFQPHRFSRTQICWDDFLEAFKLADRVFVADIYPAGELPIKGVDAKTLVNAMKSHHRDVIYGGNLLALKEIVKKEAATGQVILTLGAGDISKLSIELVSN